MTWAGRRQTVIIAVLFLIFVAIFIPIFKTVTPEASCSDGKQNQGERGVDCSGPCKKICPIDAVDTRLLWVRPFKVAEGVGSAVAYLANPNPEFVAKKVPFVMKLYDEEGLLIVDKRLTLEIPPTNTFPVFVGGMPTGNKIPKTAHFEFTTPPNWERATENDLNDRVTVSAPALNTDILPIINADIRNDSKHDLRNILVTVIVFDKEDNAMASSQTIVEGLAKDETAPVSFTWLENFQSEVGRIEIYPQIPLEI